MFNLAICPKGDKEGTINENTNSLQRFFIQKICFLKALLKVGLSGMSLISVAGKALQAVGKQIRG
jgi:hypothetical protein